MDDRNLLHAVLALCAISLIVNVMVLQEMKGTPVASGDPAAPPENFGEGSGCNAICDDMFRQLREYHDLDLTEAKGKIRQACVNACVGRADPIHRKCLSMEEEKSDFHSVGCLRFHDLLIVG